MATSKRPIKYLTITIDTQAPITNWVKKMSLSCNKVDNSGGGKDGRQYRWFSIPIAEVKKVIGRIK